jgi:hypothetical protein
MKPKKTDPLGNKMLAVLTGLGQRRQLLRPLIKKRQPKMTRNIASATETRVACSKAYLLMVFNH